MEIVIVTGSCGRIGTQITKRLCQEYSVIGLDLPNTICTAQKELIYVDLSSDASIEEGLERIKEKYGTRIASVIHLAAYYSFKEKFSPKYDQITVQGTQRLLNALKDFEVGQFVFTSTELLHKPTRPGVSITEDSPILATWGYPISKVETEQLICDQAKMPVVILRVAGVYDDFCHSIPISNQIQRIYEKQLQARFFPGNIHHGASFVHMDDLVDAIELCVKKQNELPKKFTVLIGEPKTLSYDEMQRKISKLIYNKEFSTYRIPKCIAKVGAWVQCQLPGEPFIRPWMIDYADDHYEMDIRLATRVLGWQPKHSIERALPKMVDALLKDPVTWYKGNGLKMPNWLEKKIGKRGI